MMIGGRRCDSCAVLFGEAEDDFDIVCGANQCCEFCDIANAHLVPSTAGRMPSQESSDQVTSAGIVTINLSAVAVDDGPATDDGSLLCAEKDSNCETAGVAAVSAIPRAPEAEAIKEAEVTGTPETADEVTGTIPEDEDEATDEATGAEAVDEVRSEGAGKIDRALKDAALNYLEEVTSTILYSL